LLYIKLLPESDSFNPILCDTKPLPEAFKILSNLVQYLKNSLKVFFMVFISKIAYIVFLCPAGIDIFLPFFVGLAVPFFRCSASLFDMLIFFTAVALKYSFNVRSNYLYY